MAIFFTKIEGYSTKVSLCKTKKNPMDNFFLKIENILLTLVRYIFKGFRFSGSFTKAKKKKLSRYLCVFQRPPFNKFDDRIFNKSMAIKKHISKVQVLLK